MAQRLMRPRMVVEAEGAVQPTRRFGHRLIVIEIDLLPFERPPEALHEVVVEPVDGVLGQRQRLDPRPQDGVLGFEFDTTCFWRYASTLHLLRKSG